MQSLEREGGAHQLLAVDEKPSSVAVPASDEHLPSRGSAFTNGEWTTVVGSWMILFSTFGYLYAFGVYQDFYTRFFLANHSSSAIAWIGSFQLAMPFLLGIITGKLYDSGYYHTMEILGSFLFVFSLFMLSLAKPFHYYQVFLSQGVGMGIGVGLTFTPTMSNIAHKFYERKALATGIVLSGSSAGALIFPIMLNNLIPRIGFGKAVRASAYIVLGFVVIGNCLIRRSARLIGENASPPNIKGFFVDPPYVVTVFVAVTALIGLYYPLIYIQLYANEHSVDPKLAFYSIAIINGVGGIGRVVVNLFADAYGPYNLIIPVATLAAVCIVLVLVIHDAASLVVISILYGFFSGAWLSVGLACIASLARSPFEVGARTGIVLAIASFGILGSAPIQGALLGSTFSWWKPTAFSAIMMLTSAVLVTITRQILVRDRKTQRV